MTTTSVAGRSTAAAAEPAEAPTARRSEDPGAPMTHRHVLQALSGLMLSMLVAILSSTIVTNALPVILADLHGTQGQYTWVVTAELLASTATTTLWGKASDLVSKKVLYQSALTVYVLGSVLGGFATSMGMLIGFRVVQGIGLGGMQALAQVVIGAMVSPRERGRYTGYLGAVFAIGTVSGPLLGGLIVDTPFLGWRWCFWATVPIAVIAFFVLGRTLHLPVIKRKVSIDWPGAVLLVGGVSLLLIWVSLAGKDFAWWSTSTLLYVAGAVVALALAVLVEAKAREPIVPLWLFRKRTFTLSVIATLAVGTAMFGSTVFLGQYFQLARGYSPTHAGLMTLPLVLALFVSSTLSGQIISRWTGKVKPFLVGGAILLIAGTGLLSTIDHSTSLVVVGAYLVVMGLGIGALMQNLVLVVQNTVGTAHMGAATSVVTFFRTLGGSAGVSVLGALLGLRVADYVKESVQKLTGGGAPSGGAGGGSLDVGALPEPIQSIVRAAYGDGVGDIFLIAAGVSVITLLAVVFMKEVPLRRTVEKVPEGEGPVENSAATVDRPEWPVRGSGHSVVESSQVEGVRPQDVDNHRFAVDKAVDSTPANLSNSWSAPINSNGNNNRIAGDLPVSGEYGHGLFVHGVVHGPDGAGVTDAVLTLTDAGGRQVDRDHVDEYGAYRLEVSSGGTYVLIATGGRYQPNASMVAIAERPVRRDVELSGAGVITGRVTTEADDPVGGATLVLTDVRGEVVATGVSAADGAYRLDALSGGSYAMTTTAEGHRPHATQVTVPEGEPVSVDVRLTAGGSLSGVISSATYGLPVLEAQVTLLDGNGAVIAVTTTGEDGEYSFTDLPDGDYTVLATGYPPHAEMLRVNGGQEHTHSVQLGHGQEFGRASAEPDYAGEEQ